MKAEEFRQWRNNLNICQVSAAQLLGVDRVTISRYETKGKIPKTVELVCITIEIAIAIKNKEISEATFRNSIVKGHAKHYFRKHLCEIGNMVLFLKSRDIKQS